MFAYSDPTGGSALQNANALDAYRSLVDAQYQRFALMKNSAFVSLEAFDELGAGTQPVERVIEWSAFPISAPATPQEIDRDRLNFQDEYVEWAVEGGPSGITKITFTTEFPEYFEALATAGAPALRQELAVLYPGVNPTDDQLFGPGPNVSGQSGATRAQRFRNHLTANPLNAGTRILCLTQQFNTLGALFNLLGHCGVARPSQPAASVCGSVGGACGSGRNSDPAVCLAAQNLARAKFGLSLKDPAAIVMRRLEGAWRFQGAVVDINDPANNHGLWTLTRGGRRAVLDVRQGLQLNGQPIRNGAQVPEQLTVGAAVIAAPEAALPPFAHTGAEDTRGF